MATTVIVDDNRNSCHCLARLLQHEGHAAVCTFSGTEALEATHRYKPDLLIVDLILPDMSGMELIKHLRQDPATQNQRVILITGVSDLATQAEAFRHGALDYIVKGMDWQGLLPRIEQYLAAG